jgi:hypothetical protein
LENGKDVCRGVGRDVGSVWSPWFTLFHLVSPWFTLLGATLHFTTLQDLLVPREVFSEADMRLE